MSVSDKMVIVMNISFHQKGSFKNTEKFLKRASDQINQFLELNKYGQMGVEALSAATPIRTGKTAESWSYMIETSGDGITISWYNDNVNDGFNVAIGLQYGHGLKNGSYVKGIDYINPALKPIFDEIAEKAWGEVRSW